MKYKPQIGDLLYIKKGRWDSLGMIVEQSPTKEAWTVEWLGQHPLIYPGFTYEEIAQHRQGFLELRKSLCL